MRSPACVEYLNKGSVESDTIEAHSEHSQFAMHQACPAQAAVRTKQCLGAMVNLVADMTTHSQTWHCTPAHNLHTYSVTSVTPELHP